MIPTREQAWGILAKYVTTDSQRKHGMAVEAAMRYFARKAGQDEELWGVVGLLHDVDYELYPEEHCLRAREILQKEGVDEGIKSVKKKFQDRRFAAGCNRDVIRRGAERMGISLDELMEVVILGMRDAADALGLGMQA